MVEDRLGGLHSCPEVLALLGLSKEHCCHPTLECAIWDISWIFCSLASGDHLVWGRTGMKGCSDEPVVDDLVEEGDFDVHGEGYSCLYLRALVDWQ